MEDCTKLSLKFDILLKQKWKEYYEVSCIEKKPYVKAYDEYQKIFIEKDILLKKCNENKNIQQLLKNSNTLFE